MGLDITAYRQIAPDPSAALDEYGDPVDYKSRQKFWINPDFPEHAEGIDTMLAHSFAEKFDFRAGSYIGYSRWREDLAKFAGYPAVLVERWAGGMESLHAGGAWKAGEGPFYELIHFSDCEGTIGPAVSAKLLADFIAHEERAMAVDDDWFRALYMDWKRAFALAADGGAVQFH